MISNFDRDIQVRWGTTEFTMQVHPENELLSNIIRQKGRYSSADQQVFSQFLKAGGTFIDIGANIGWYSLVASSVLGAGGLVLAIEPEPKNLQLLDSNLKRGCQSRYQILPFALGEEESQAELFLSDDNFGDHSLLRSGAKINARQKVEVQIRRLDQLISPEEFKNVQLLKMDTQGYEPRILSSLKPLLKSHRPPLMVEFSPSHIYECNSSPFEIFAFLENERYFPLHINDETPPGQSAVSPLSIDALFHYTKTLRNANYGIDLLLLPMEHPLVSG